MANEIIFGTDGWRGLIDKEVNKGSVGKVAQAFAIYLKARPKNSNDLKVVVAYDGRQYSKQFAILFARILSGNSITTFLADKTSTTPALSFYVKEHELNAGVMITASHNPPEYNGVKFKDYYGGPFFTEETLDIEKLVGKELVQADDEKVYQVDIRNGYYQQLERLVNFQLIKEAGLNILIDSMGGAGQQVIETILRKYDIQAKTIFKIAEPDFSGRLAEPIEKNLLPLKDELQKNLYSIGIATDGDADRVGIMMENGEWLSAQETILLLTDFIINKKKIKGHLVKTSSVTDKLKHCFENDERKVFDVQVGFKYICEKMIQEDIAFGCEESGGYGYKGHMPERDGILSGLLFIEMLARSGYTKLSDYVIEKRKEFGAIHYSRIDFEYKFEDRLLILPNLASKGMPYLEKFNISEKHEFFSSHGVINGLKFRFENSSKWLLIRCSETEPLFRIYAEGESDAEVEELLILGKTLIEKDI
jgi:phosphomannomutase